MEEKGVHYFRGKSWKREILERHRHRLEDNMNIVPKEEGWNGLDEIYLTQNIDTCPTVVNTIMKLRVPKMCEI
jgi:hypothetical protein